MCHGSESGCVLCVHCFGRMVGIGVEREQVEFDSDGDIEAD